MRREIPLGITFIAGAIMLLDSFTKGPFESIAKDLSKWVIIISALMLPLATVNLIRIHGGSIARRRPGWFYSLVLLTGLVGYAVIGIVKVANPDAAWWLDVYQKIYDNVLAPLGSAMFAIVAFYVASASYRAFRARSLEASVLLVAALVVMLGRAPIGALIWSKFPVIADWLLKWANTAGQRGIMIGAAIGAFVTSLRILIGLERGHLGGVE